MIILTNLFKILFFLIIPLVLLLAFMELSLRTVYYIKNHIITQDRSFSEYLGWKTKEKIHKISFVEGYGEINFSTKKYGFREFGDTASDKIKIFVIGDSFTEGHCVSDGSMYYNYLKNNNTYIEIFAYGCSGYGSLQEYMILDAYIDEIKPDLILLQIMSNDLINNSHEVESFSLINNNQMVRPYYSDGEIHWLFPTQLQGWRYKLIQNSYLLKFFNIRFNFLAEKIVGSIEENELKLEHPFFKKAILITTEIFSMIKKRVGKTPIVAFSMGEEEIFKNICQNNSIHFIGDMDIPIRAAKNKGLKVDNSPYDNHWNDRGNLIVGGIIFKYLEDNKFLNKCIKSESEYASDSKCILERYRPIFKNR